MSLDDDLRLLFGDLSADARLDVRVRPDAEEVILAGAHRVRRLRCLTVTAGALVLVVLVGGGIAVAAGGSERSLPPAHTSVSPTATTTRSATSATPASPTTTLIVNPPSVTTGESAVGGPPAVEPPRGTGEGPPPLTDGVLRASGYGPFELGMSTEDALATGLLTRDADGGDCTGYAINGGGRLLVSDQAGLVRVQLPEWVRTPAGLGAGSTVGEVRAVHPEAADHRGGVTATAGGGSFYDFVTVVAPPLTAPIPDALVVGELRLVSTANDCALAM